MSLYEYSSIHIKELSWQKCAEQTSCEIFEIFQYFFILLVSTLFSPSWAFLLILQLAGEQKKYLIQNSLWLNCTFLYNKNDLYCTYASEASSSLIKASLTGGRSCLMFRPLTYGADSLSVSFNCPQNKRDTITEYIFLWLRQVNYGTCITISDQVLGNKFL